MRARIGILVGSGALIAVSSCGGEQAAQPEAPIAPPPTTPIATRPVTPPIAPTPPVVAIKNYLVACEPYVTAPREKDVTAALYFRMQSIPTKGEYQNYSLQSLRAFPTRATTLADVVGPTTIVSDAISQATYERLKGDPLGFQYKFSGDLYVHEQGNPTGGGVMTISKPSLFGITCELDPKRYIGWFNGTPTEPDPQSFNKNGGTIAQCRIYPLPTEDAPLPALTKLEDYGCPQR